jgi:biopolymer transport protein ExbD
MTPLCDVTFVLFSLFIVAVLAMRGDLKIVIGSLVHQKQFLAAGVEVALNRSGTGFALLPFTVENS